MGAFVLGVALTDAGRVRQRMDEAIREVRMEALPVILYALVTVLLVLNEASLGCDLQLLLTKTHFGDQSVRFGTLRDPAALRYP